MKNKRSVLRRVSALFLCLAVMATTMGATTIAYADSDGATPTDTPVEAKYEIIILPPTGWYAKTAWVEVRITDVNKTGWKSISVRVNEYGDELDLTDEYDGSDRANVEINDDCTVYATVTDKNGKAHTASKSIACFDRIAPVLQAGVSGGTLHAEATDALSGVAALYVNNSKYVSFAQGTADLPLAGVGSSCAKITLYATDNAGNHSNVITLDNPYYVAPTPEPTATPQATAKPTAKPTAASASTDTPAASSTPSATATPFTEQATQYVTTDPLTPEGNLSLIDDVGSQFIIGDKQYITVQSKNGNYFYIVIDRSGDTENVYFLNLVDEADLMALMEDGETVTPIEPETTPTPEPTSTPEPVETEPEKESGSSGLIIAVVVLLLLGGGAFYYFKFVKGKGKKAPIVDELDDFDYGDDEDAADDALEEGIDLDTDNDDAGEDNDV